MFFLSIFDTFLYVFMFNGSAKGSEISVSGEKDQPRCTRNITFLCIINVSQTLTDWCTLFLKIGLVTYFIVCKSEGLNFCFSKKRKRESQFRQYWIATKVFWLDQSRTNVPSLYKCFQFEAVYLWEHNSIWYKQIDGLCFWAVFLGSESQWNEPRMRRVMTEHEEQRGKWRIFKQWLVKAVWFLTAVACFLSYTLNPLHDFIQEIRNRPQTALWLLLL